MKKSVNFLLCAAFLAFIYGCRKETKIEMPPRNVKTGKAITADVPVYINAFGYLRGEYSVDIKAQVTGKIIEANFTQGQIVKKGQILFTIDKKPYQAELAKAEAELLEDQQNLKLKKYIVQSDKILYKKKAISVQNYAKLVTDMDYVAAQVETDKAMVASAKINLGYCDILSPIDGVTGVRQVDPGNIVPANTGPTLVNVRTTDLLYVDFSISERYLQAVRYSKDRGILQVIATTDEISVDHQTYSGKLEFLNNSVSNNTGTILLRAIMPNKQNKLWAGQFVKIRLVLCKLKDALLAPTQAIKIGKTGSYLFTVGQDNKAHLKEIKTWLTEGDYTVVIKGDVKPGDNVVTAGQMALDSGVPVKIIGTSKASLDSSSENKDNEDKLDAKTISQFIFDTAKTEIKPKTKAKTKTKAPTKKP